MNNYPPDALETAHQPEWSRELDTLRREVHELREELRLRHEADVKASSGQPYAKHDSAPTVSHTGGDTLRTDAVYFASYEEAGQAQAALYKPEWESAKVIGLKRHAAGYWAAQVVVRLRVHLPDGRAIYGLHIVPIRCSQLGRKGSRRVASPPERG